MSRLAAVTGRILLVAMAALFAPAAAAAQAPTVVIIVRHAEKAAAPADDPPLTEAGAARARALAAAVADAKVEAVITTQLARTRETARPAAEARGIAMETVTVGGTPVAEHAWAVAAAVRRHAGHTVLVVGHSNTVTRIIEALGGPSLPDLCDSQYSTLFTLVLNGSSARLVTSEYGAPSPAVKTGCPAMR